MKALSCWQPWATLVVRSLAGAGPAKRFETRAWLCNYRGPIVIHASQRTRGLDERSLALLDELAREHLRCRLADLPLGALVGQADIIACIPTEDFQPGPLERKLGNYQPGRYAIGLADAVEFAEPIYARGHQRFWNLLPAEEQAVVRALQAASRAGNGPPASNPLTNG